MVDAIDSKSIASNGVRVQVPWLVPILISNDFTNSRFYVIMYIDEGNFIQY